jgi:hypothetical protein
MSYEDDVQIIITLRNFESDSDYLSFDDYWIQKLSEEDKIQLGEDINSFRCNTYDNYILGRWYYIGRGKSSTVLRDNSIMFVYQLFRALKLFKTGDLITPMCFYTWKGKTRGK